jgi:hypothetical protein
MVRLWSRLRCARTNERVPYIALISAASARPWPHARPNRFPASDRPGLGGLSMVDYSPHLTTAPPVAHHIIRSFVEDGSSVLR